MVKKLVIGVLVMSLVGGAAVALLDSSAPAPIAAVAPTTTRTAAPAVAPTATNQPVSAPVLATPQPAQNSLNNVGTVWASSGTIVALTSVGMTLALPDGSEVYVELGSPTYWQAQGVTLQPGDTVLVDGFFNGENYHARTVTTASGAVLALRNETGQPLWSGGNENSGAASGTGQAQVPAEEWVTVAGTVLSLTTNGLVMQTDDAQPLTISLGQPNFWPAQNVTLAAGDAVELRGFWQADQFHVGQLTKIATGERILLRDPNGRPLWGGPGRNQGSTASGAQAGSGQQANGTGGQGNNANSAQAGGQGNRGGGGNGNGGSGNGRGGSNGGQGSNGQQQRAQLHTPTTVTPAPGQ
jgi:hypothetical protein